MTVITVTRRGPIPCWLVSRTGSTGAARACTTQSSHCTEMRPRAVPRWCTGTACNDNDNNDDDDEDDDDRGGDDGALQIDHPQSLFEKVTMIIMTVNVIIMTIIMIKYIETPCEALPARLSQLQTSIII